MPELLPGARDTSPGGPGSRPPAAREPLAHAGPLVVDSAACDASLGGEPLPHFLTIPKRLLRLSSDTARTVEA